MAVPPPAVSRETAALAAAREDMSAGTRYSVPGKTIRATCVPATTAKGTPSRIASIAASVACRAAAILVGG